MKSLQAPILSIAIALTFLGWTEHACWANSDERKWTTKNQESFTAELVFYDDETDEVTLKFNDQDDRVYPLDSFSTADKAWILEWSEVESRLVDTLKASPGDFEHIVTDGEYPTDLFIFYPSARLVTEKPLPALILFHPAGKAARNMLRYLEAAESCGLILISCGQFRNTGDDPKKEQEMLNRFRDIFPYITKNITFDHDQLFMGGSSGGAWRAFHYTAWIDWPWAGVFSNGGWMGGKKYYQEDYAPNMRVALVNGNNDRNANYRIDAITEIIHQKQGTVAVISFEGGHQPAPPYTQTKAFHWLLNQEEFDEKPIK